MKMWHSRLHLRRDFALFHHGGAVATFGEFGRERSTTTTNTTRRNNFFFPLRFQLFTSLSHFRSKTDHVRLHSANLATAAEILGRSTPSRPPVYTLTLTPPVRRRSTGSTRRFSRSHRIATRNPQNSRQTKVDNASTRLSIARSLSPMRRPQREPR